ncbi:unnamed protein product [Ilex paraguariensis]|uniref:Expansin-like EG45 domain-containing protein n=1 Tax=Ilex paraguariensis TaxID=185542 RepID=A0ABC8TJ84_9AQUA
MATQPHFSFRAIALVFLPFPLAAFADEGSATFYTPPYWVKEWKRITLFISSFGDATSACNGYNDDGVMIAAASDAIWDNGGACGTRYSVTCLNETNLGDPHPCNGNSVVVTIVDYCPPPGCRGTLDLSQEAFSSIANRDAGKINIHF